jgi:hypothetical protein
MSFDADRGSYVVRNPVNKQKKRFADEAQARAAALALAALLVNEQTLAAFTAGRGTVAQAVRAIIAEELPRRPISPGTRANELARFNRVARELGERVIATTTPLELQSWLRGTAEGGELFNKYRATLVHVWRYAVLHNMTRANIAEQVPVESTSKKLAVNRKARGQLEVSDFWAIHAKAPAWLQLAMELSLKTLQSRSEVVKMKFEHFHDAQLYVVRDKVSAKSHMGFIRIAMDEELEALRRRGLTVGREHPTTNIPICARALDLHKSGMGRAEIAARLGSTPKKITQLICHERKRRETIAAVVSPYVVHYRPERRVRAELENKAHWTCVTPGHLSEVFKEARDAAGLWSHLPVEKRPTFHEIRGLGARLMLERLVTEGVPAGEARARVSSLLTHSQPATTAIYLEKGRSALTDADYHPVRAVVSLADYRPR